MACVRTTLLVSLFVLGLACVLAQSAETTDDAQETERLSARACPNSCSGNGACSGTTCSCYSGWAGVDCSVADLNLAFNLPVTSTVSRKMWQYYHTSFSQSSGGIKWAVQQTSASADCDLYIQLNDYPSQYSYADRDTSSDQSFSIIVDPAQAGTWYAGVFGYTDCTYTITVSVVSACPNGCSNHGVCDASNATCTCSFGWTGQDCAQQIVPITGLSLSNQQVPYWSWIYYYYNNTANNNIIVSVNQQSSSEDCDLYIKYNAIPSFYVYDYRDQSTNQNFAVTIPSPSHGTYYIGIFGWTQCSFSISALAQPGCSSRCSLHGSCSGSSCSCSSGYTGGYCEQATGNMTNGITYSGFADSSFWNYYSLRQTGTGNVLVTLQQVSGTCSLYVRANANPTLSNYVLVSTGSAASKTLTIPQPDGAIWKIGVYGAASCQYQLTSTFQATCPGTPVCSGHGSCVSGICSCQSGYSGLACDHQQASLLSNSTLSGSVGLGQWVYYTISGVQSAATIHLMESATTGAVWLFAGSSSITLQNFQYSDINGHSKNHNIVIPRLTSSAPTTYYIGVYGDPGIASGQSAAYQISAFLTPW